MFTREKRRNHGDATTAANRPQRLLRHALIALVLAAPTPSLAAQHYDLPDLGSPANAALPPAKADKLGADTVRQMRQRGLVLQDAELTAYINRLGRKLTKHTKRPPNEFHFFVTDEAAINAFALPGGYIGINAGLILATRNVSELAAVMGHEIGHVVQNHIARQMQEMTPINWATGAAMLAALAAGIASGNPDVAPAAMGLGAAGNYQAHVDYTRADEMEADHVGIRILAQSGFNPMGMVTFFQRLQQETRLYGNQIPAILQTHPVTSVRIAEARERAEKYPPVHLKPDLAYELMRARTRVISASNASDAEDYFRKQHRNHPHSQPAAYGYALALDQAAKHGQAIRLLRPLLHAHPDNLHYRLALADAELGAGDAKQAVSLLSAALKGHGKYAPLVLAYANALLRDHQSQQARDALTSSGSQIFDKPQARKLLAQAAAQQGRTGEAYYQRAEYYRLEGQRHTAIDQLKTALKLPNLSADDRARIKARLQQLEQRAKKQKENG